MATFLHHSVEKCSPHRGATHQVLALPELFEVIIRHLPWRDLFVVQLVNKNFYYFIAESAAARRAMSLDPPVNPHDPIEWPNYNMISPLLAGDMISWGRFNPGNDGLNWRVDAAGLIFSINYDVWNPQCRVIPAIYDRIGMQCTWQKSKILRI